MSEVSKENEQHMDLLGQIGHHGQPSRRWFYLRDVEREAVSRMAGAPFEKLSDKQIESLLIRLGEDQNQTDIY